MKIISMIALVFLGFSNNAALAGPPAACPAGNLVASMHCNSTPFLTAGAVNNIGTNGSFGYSNGGFIGFFTAYNSAPSLTCVYADNSYSQSGPIPYAYQWNCKVNPNNNLYITCCSPPMPPPN